MLHFTLSHQMVVCLQDCTIQTKFECVKKPFRIPAGLKVGWKLFPLVLAMRMFFLCAWTCAWMRIDMRMDEHRHEHQPHVDMRLMRMDMRINASVLT